MVAYWRHGVTSRQVKLCYVMKPEEYLEPHGSYSAVQPSFESRKWQRRFCDQACLLQENPIRAAGHGVQKAGDLPLSSPKP